jgi:hypothetical protein
MALIIGNGEYERFDCGDCHNSAYRFSNLTVAPNLEQLKKKLEKNDFYVMACLDLEAENFLRVIRLFREKCETAKSVLAFIYIGAHGFHRGMHDFVVPVNFQDITHEKKHVLTPDLNHQTLATLLENFCQSDDETEKPTKFTLIVFWDLCRELCINFPVDSYSNICKNLEYSIIYSWYVLYKEA